MVGLKELMGIALKIEGAGFAYYQKLMERASGKMKELFADLAEQERAHAETFRTMLDDEEKDQSKSGWIEEESAGYLSSYAEISIFPKLQSDEIPASFEDAVKLAMDVEKESIIFYSEIKEYLPKQRDIAQIISEEKDHLRRLVRIYGEK
ncbi:MAG: Uncharacterized protein XE05_1220 [Thermotogales bacterium 46_20]|nr:MAG: Uncharacterized protein XE05_1220 [Thermotogales bacterium 46_20]